MSSCMFTWCSVLAEFHFDRSGSQIWMGSAHAYQLSNIKKKQRTKKKKQLSLTSTSTLEKNAKGMNHVLSTAIAGLM